MITNIFRSTAGQDIFLGAIESPFRPDEAAIRMAWIEFLSEKERRGTDYYDFIDYLVDKNCGFVKARPMGKICVV